MVGAEGLTERDYGETLKGQVCPNRPTTSIELNFHMNILNIIRYACLLLFLAVLSSIPYNTYAHWSIYGHFGQLLLL